MAKHTGRGVSAIDILRWGAPFATTSPSATSRSEGSISSSFDAISRMRSRAFSAAKRTALPPMNVPRDANVPVQTGDESVFELS